MQPLAKSLKIAGEVAAIQQPKTILRRKGVCYVSRLSGHNGTNVTLCPEIQ
jgi:hypothetical protein